MRKGMLGAIAGVTAGAAGAWGQSPTSDPPAPAAVAPAGNVVQVQDFGPVPPGAGLPPGFGAPGGGPFHSLPPAIMPPIGPGPGGDPQGFGPMGGFGPPPGPMYPPPGQYGAPQFEPAGGPNALGGAYNTAPHVWTTFEYLLWYSKSQTFPVPLLTSSAPTDLGLLNRASTLILYGSGAVDVNPLNGARITGGFFGDADRRFGFEASGFVTENGANRLNQITSPSGIPLLARPFRDSANPNVLTSLVVGSPLLGQTQVTVLNTQQTYSVEASGVLNLYRSEPGCRTAFTLDAIGGYRHLNMAELYRERSATVLNLPSVTTPIVNVGPFGQTTVVGTTVTPGTLNVAGLLAPSGSIITVVDTLRTRNDFNGGQVGLRGELRHGMFSVAASGKLAAGHMRQVIEVDGYTQVTPTAATAATALPGATPVSGRAFGGLFGNAATIGKFSHDEFTVIPEFNLTLGMAVTRNTTMWVGCNVIYIDNVIRPGTELTPIVNTATVPLSPNYGALGRPLVTPVRFNQDEFWMLGLNTGFTIRF